MALEGDLSIFRLPDILQVIAQQQKTGILTVQGESDILAVSFHQGMVVAADALNQSFEEMLGEVLASQGVLSPERFQRLSEEHRTIAGERLADFLIRRGALSREQLLSALRFQTYRLLLEVLGWKVGEFKFYSGEEVAFEEGMEPLAVDEVLYRSMRDLLGEGTVAGAMPHGFVAYEAVLQSKPLRVVREAPTALEREADVIWISADERAVLDRLDGKLPAERLAQESGLGDLRTQYALFHLLRAGLVRPAGETPPEGTASGLAPAPPPRLERTGTGVRAPVAPSAAAEAVLERDSPRAVPYEERIAYREDTHAALMVPPAERVALARIAAGVATVLGIAALVLAILRPAPILLPYPARGAERQGLERIERQDRMAAIDRAARSFYLLEGRYPASLDDLVSRRLIGPQQRFDPAGRPLMLRPSEDAYALVVAGAPPEEVGDGGGDDLVVTESVAGDVLLDRTLFAGIQDESGVPLVLLD